MVTSPALVFIIQTHNRYRSDMCSKKLYFVGLVPAGGSFAGSAGHNALQSENVAKNNSWFQKPAILT